MDVNTSLGRYDAFEYGIGDSQDLYMLLACISRGPVVVGQQVERLSLMPPERWLIQLDPETESLGALLRRLRTERGWTQPQLAALVDPARANDVQVMKNLQALLSRYESDATKRPDPILLATLEGIYALPED